jgi:glyoxylase-like metal-dependent hydrolase (beta-lactamase superfamily II)
MYYFPKEKALIGGDLIICGAVGRTDFEDSDPAELNKSIRKVMKLPDDTRLLPGHCETSTLGEERESNPYVREALGESEI